MPVSEGKAVQERRPYRGPLGTSSGGTAGEGDAPDAPVGCQCAVISIEADVLGQDQMRGLAHSDEVARAQTKAAQ